jgi:hypothetical protein
MAEQQFLTRAARRFAGNHCKLGVKLTIRLVDSKLQS